MIKSKANVVPVVRPKQPTASDIKQARKAAGLSQADAAELIYKTRRQWIYYEKGETGLDLALWELFNLKIEKMKVSKVS